MIDTLLELEPETQASELPGSVCLELIVTDADSINENLTGALRDYFDPGSGRFQERLERLIKKEGELEQVLRRQIGCQGSELANTLAAHVGENSPLMKLLDPDESKGLVNAL